MGYDKQRFLTMLAAGLCSKGRRGKTLPPAIYLAAGNWSATEWLTFSSAEPFTLATKNSAKNWNGSLYYSTDTVTWSEWDGTTISSAQSGGRQNIYIRGKGNRFITGTKSTSSKCWVLTGTDIACFGNIENLLDYETVMSGEHPPMAASCYAYIFSDCDSLVTPPALPATKLSSDCYYRMFYNCKSLVTAPELPATTLAEWCYAYMFEECDSLVTPPALPATTLARYCYQNMFARCNALAALPKLPARTLKFQCYWAMFNSCSNIKLSETQSGEYQTPYRIPTTGSGSDTDTYIGDMSNAMATMFGITGGTFTGTPKINTTYYTSNTVI